MSTKQYDRASLIHAYIDANRLDYIHEDFRTYYTGLFDALQKAFDVSLSNEGVRNHGVYALWFLFRATMHSYQHIRTPFSGFLEASAIVGTLERLGNRVEPVDKLAETIEKLAADNKEAHLRLLDELFVLLWGPVDAVVTSEGLLAVGFDDTKEPKESDYFDYL